MSGMGKAIVGLCLDFFPRSPFLICSRENLWNSDTFAGDGSRRAPEQDTGAGGGAGPAEAGDRPARPGAPRRAVRGPRVLVAARHRRASALVVAQPRQVVRQALPLDTAVAGTGRAHHRTRREDPLLVSFLFLPCVSWFGSLCSTLTKCLIKMLNQCYQISNSLRNLHFFTHLALFDATNTFLPNTCFCTIS